MSLPTPHIQALSTYRREWRASSTNRNISNPYSLAIPARTRRRSSSIYSQNEDSIKLGPKSASSLDTLQFVKPLDKAVLVTEKPVRPFAYDRNSASTIFAGCQHASPYEPAPKKSRVCGLIEDRVLALSVTITLAILIAIAIPLAIILPPKMIKALPINVLVPFFVYPLPGAWNPLIDVYVLLPSLMAFVDLL
jgi:hypothetical protein